ncbi:iron-sulfur cluster carrier protein ApbC [Sneathiella chungangensis]|uniref:Iron-sulfur cluster carrier protein n=1 Tax=Sneathiella chungangensis TaxID=1418234 RepID=A0A845MFZ9_9PROT|nr:iron-sulfur cluster carrier protein ApbC [Sneathiella chungangensis]MZR22177.1 iron-sulfur cluster carrier protein ApbC [Sneathiella chungangensis]
MSAINEQTVINCLDQVIDPKSGKSAVALGLIAGLVIKDGNVGFALEINPKEANEMELLRKKCEDAVFALPGVKSVSAVLTAEQAAAAPSRPQTPPQQQPAQKPEVPGVAAIVAVASGKGGVGKSTCAVNLALGLAALGLKVGMLDADVYGPSLPRMLGLKGKPQSKDGKKLIPMEKWGLKVMSMGFLVEEDTPMIWRGPMIMSALQQMVFDVDWGALDVLIVDMPPGTGDAQLTLAQKVPLAGAVIVSTPQDIALIDARKGLNMFRKVDVPVFGIIENMSYFLCPSCGERSDIFGHGGAHETAKELGVDFLGEVPLHMDIRKTSDAGTPITATEPDSAHAKIYRDLAAKVQEKIEQSLATASGPKIVIE